MNYVVVPIKIDALWVHSDEYAVLNQVADFSKLPYVSSELGDVNSDVANISEMVLQQSFASSNLRLGNGLHLHWALPDALTKGEEGPEDMIFPSVPDRWLINRLVNGTIQKQWIVESNYLYPEGINRQGATISIPYRDDDSEQSYRFMGRQMPLATWMNKTAAQQEKDQYYHPFTALGYGEASFAAYYPNSFSVFGFYDKEVTEIKNVSYQVVGWYGNSEKDELSRLLKSQKISSIEAAKELLKEEFEWCLPADVKDLPTGTICYAQLDFAQDASTDYPASKAAPKITVANSATEALSASLADHLKDQIGTDPQKALEVIENQLEAVQMSYQLGSKELDVMSRFREMRHENGFTAQVAGYLWTVGFESQASLEDKKEVSIPAEISRRLSAINKLQKAYNLAEDEQKSRKLQLFADWYKYMIAKYPPDRLKEDYPDVDEIKLFIEQKVLTPLQQHSDEKGELILPDEEATALPRFGHNSTEENSLASQLAKVLNELDVLLVQTNQLEATKGSYYLKQLPAPRFWEPNDPVVLLEGEGIISNDRNGHDDELEVLIFNADDNLEKDGFDALLRFLQNQKEFGLRTFSEQPWNPFQLEWSLQFYPLETRGNAPEDVTQFSKDYITHNYETRVTAHDLLFKLGRGKISRKASLYQGSSLLTEQAKSLLLDRIKEHLEKQGVLEAYERENSAINLPEDIDALLEWYTNQAEVSQKPGILIQLKAYQKAKDMTFLSQAIGGLNEAMLMTKQTMELAVSDPLAFGAEDDMTSDLFFSNKAVNQALGESLVNAPAPLNEFHPVRAGAIKFNQLRLIDTFGQSMELSVNNIDTTYKMTVPGNSYLIQLPPRLSQPARLDFRWLYANEGQAEMDTDQGDHPICGWLLTNKLDKSLSIFDEDGKALGYFQASQWRKAVGSEKAALINEISNPHLQRMLQFIDSAISEDPEKDNEDIDRRFLSQYIATIEDALNNIQPERSMQQQGLTMLAGRPVAMVRAKLSLELQGLPAINQKWEAFRNDLNTNSRTTDGFTHIKFPVRLGEYRQLNDGLVGYWLEDHNSEGVTYLNNKFYSPGSDVLDNQWIESQFNSAEGPINFLHSIEDAPQFISMLMDPLGSVHATVGILPNKEISIPENAYTKAMSAIEMTFLTAPILTDHDKIQIPLPKDENFTWSWLERTQYQPEESWSEVKSVAEITIHAFTEGWEKYGVPSINALAVWNHLKSKAIGWLSAINDELCQVTPKEERASDQFLAPFEQMENRVQAVLDVYLQQIASVETEANFTGPKAIKEGWLKLKKN